VIADCFFFFSPEQFKKDYGKDDPNGNDPNSASRGNWWQGMVAV
jgi:hypothetical protein